ncbi:MULTISPECIES: TadE/TadG family type IV pilus assembly protein [Photobacterium]|uniref:TadE/TadG family type IV pilus assembly protein n=1 Tax=Photobacterium TaxID=657 RepID=UPI001EE02873|nr:MULTISPECIES: TadE/TadG family type IV pilus assembly protein [Photobacterium]MCG3865448.1 pilus assembly protein [Photobacterium sp. Ph6]MCG3876930.1 pilus assembly protein [Photobacterium sp. Ph5]
MKHKKQNGSVSIEFAMSSIVLFMMIFAVFELTRFIYINNLVDIAITESARDSRIHQSKSDGKNSYAVINSNRLWNVLLINRNDINTTMQCYRNISDITSNVVTNCDNANLIFYTLTYNYHPMFIFNGVAERKISRSILIQNEYQGW